MKAIGISPGRRVSYIDHIVPLCQLMGIPLLCTDPWIANLIECFYPPMELLLDESKDFSLDGSLKPFDTLFYVDLHRKPHGGFQFVEHFYSGKARSVCGLHGNSDKKRNLFWAEKYADEDIVLLYGQHMVDFLEEKKVTDRFRKAILTGNFRYEYYLENKEFLDSKIAPFLFPKNGKKTILYATTWTSQNRRSDWRVDYSSFFEVYSSIFEQIPDDFQLLVKLHPHLVFLYPNEVEEIKQRYEGDERILFLDDLPPIYPLLSQVDVYLGDYSSVGYDFLTFNKPLFFINDQQREVEKDSGVYLYRCGIPISLADVDSLYSIIRDHPEKELEKERREVYSYAFGARKSLGSLKNEIGEALCASIS